MTREQLIKAIYDNDDAWSCPEYACDMPEKEGNTGECCWDCAEKQLKAYEDKIREEGRKEAILYVRKLIKMFWKDWNKTSHKKLPYLAFEELDEHILEQADESNGRVFMQWYKEQNND